MGVWGLFPSRIPILLYMNNYKWPRGFLLHTSNYNSVILYACTNNVLSLVLYMSLKGVTKLNFLQRSILTSYDI